MKVTAIGPGTPLALKVEAARIYPLQVTVDGRTRVYEDQDVQMTIFEGTWFTLTIPEQRTSGYRWMVSSGLKADGDVVMMEDRMATTHGKVEPIGSRLMTLKINSGAASLQKLTLELRRPFQVATPAAARKDITIEVLPEPAVRIMR
jgi:predicted secreted protein